MPARRHGLERFPEDPPNTPPGNDAMYKGFFINLSSSQERREALARHLEEIGAAARYQRFEAVDGRTVAHQYKTSLDPGNLGCWLSNLGVLTANRSSDLHLHIIEDDIIFARNAVHRLDSLLAHADAHLEWDLIFSEIQAPFPDISVFLLFREKLALYEQSNRYSFIPLSGMRYSSLCSYFVNRRSIDKLAKLIAGKWTVGLPLDLYVRDLVNQKVLTASVILPFLTSLSPLNLESVVRGPYDRSRTIATVFRRAFFKEADLQSLASQTQELIQGAQLSPLTSLYLNTLLFALSDQWTRF
jgi:GR25 family glycosyltransferase involved in LPS biosynthesis